MFFKYKQQNLRYEFIVFKLPSDGVLLKSEIRAFQETFGKVLILHSK